ncbi:MAG: hypothetical protein M1820_003072 [Bogoriella megaspora]|nr:MAG: hypothetical protein M1820_003072 [Bogoriella megaspora]
MDVRHYRPSSPGGRRLAVPERSSTGNVSSVAPYEPYYPRSTPRDVYNPPRGGNDGGVIPISTTTYVTNRPPTITRNGSSSTTGYDTYSGRPRRSTLTEADAIRGGSSGHRSGSSRTRPAVITHTAAYEQPKSPRLAQDRDYFVTPSTSGPHRHHHKKVYSVDDGKSRLLDERETRPRKDSVDRTPYKMVTNGGRNKAYHLSGPRQGSSDDYPGYSYTDPAGMYRDTEPRWRPRRGSVESGRRPTSMLETAPARVSDRQLGPPPSTRGFDKIPDSLQRTGSLTNTVRSPTAYDAQPYESTVTASGYAPPPRPSSARPPTTVHQDQRYAVYPEEYERESRGPTRKYEDSNVESRGFGIRSGSTDRYAARDTSLDRRPIYQNQQNPLISEPDLRTYIPEPVEPPRREPERRDREHPRERERPRDRDRERDWEPDRERERERDQREPPRHRERERERDRDRERDKEREPRELRERERDREYDKDRRRDRDREDDRDRKHSRDDRDHEESKSRLPGIGAAAAALGAAALGGEALRERKRDKERDKEREYDEDDESSRRHRKHEETDRELRHSDEDRRELREPRDRVEREKERRPSPRESVSETSDPDADYRRRVAQAQQELQRSNKDGHDDSSGSDEDVDRREVRRRERRERRDREAREREERDRPREERNHDRPIESTRDIENDIPTPRIHDERRQSVFDGPIVSEPDLLNEESSGNGRETRVRIVEPPKDDKEEAPQPRGILRKPTSKFPEDPNPIREGVAPLKDAKQKGIPPGARWTKIDRRLVNPEALEDAKERFEERQDCVIVLRVLSKEDIQKFADRTKEIRDERYERERREQKARRREERDRDPEGYASRKHHRRRHSRTEDSNDGSTEVSSSTANRHRDHNSNPNPSHHSNRDRDREGGRRKSRRDGTDGAESDSYSEDDTTGSEAEYEDAREKPRAIEAPPQMLPQSVPGAHGGGVSFAGPPRERERDREVETERR